MYFFGSRIVFWCFLNIIVSSLLLKSYNLAFSLISILIVDILKTTRGISSIWTLCGLVSIIVFFLFNSAVSFLPVRLVGFLKLSARHCIWKNLGDKRRPRVMLLSSRENLLLLLIVAKPEHSQSQISLTQMLIEMLTFRLQFTGELIAIQGILLLGSKWNPGYLPVSRGQALNSTCFSP